MKERRLASVVICLLLAFAVVAQGPQALAQSDDLKAIQRAMGLAGEGKLLAAMNAMEADSIDPNLASQISSLLYSFVGDWERVHDLQNSNQKNNIVTAPPGAIFLPAIGAIVDEARSHRIVIVNESHDSPHHREFILQLARRLRDVGFEYYAMETLGEDAQALKMRGYPVRTTGTYSNEPAYGELVRQALKIGYTPVAYEAESTVPSGDPADDINMRDQAQCENLIERVISIDPDAKMLVHVGHDHVMESPRKAGGKDILWLAGRLKKETGIDPLSIDQITNLHVGAEFGKRHDEPIVLSNTDGQIVVGGYFEGTVDIQVFHPPPQVLDGRPDWLASSKDRVAVPLPPQIDGDSGRLLVQAFHADESADAVPADQFVLTDDKPRPVLMLRPGRYRIVIQDESGNETSRDTLSVPKNPC